MKAKNGIYRVALLAAVLLSTILPARVTAQTTVYFTPGIAADNSIVRRIDPVKAIVYSELSGAGYFSHVDYFTMQEIRMPLVAGLVVRDFEVYINQYVFFCGKDGNGGVIGWFDINDLVAGINFYHYYDLSSQLCPVNIEDVLKMEVYDYLTDIHIVAVAQIKGVNPYYYTRGLMDVCFDFSIPTAVPTPTVEVRYDNTGADYFEDVAVTNNYVATVSRKTIRYGIGQFVRVFDRPTSIGDNIFTSGNYVNVYYSAYSIPNPNVNPMMLITAMTGNNAATVMFVEDVGIPSVEVDVYDLMAPAPPLSRIVSPESTDRLRDFVYNSFTNSFYILYDQALGAPNNIMEIQYPAAPLISPNVYTQANILHSLDRWPDVYVLSSGEDVSTQDLSYLNLLTGSTNSCATYYHNPINTTSQFNNSGKMELESCYPQPGNNWGQITVSTNIIKDICH